MTNQVTCRCSAYNFPHRIGGGTCNGSEWAESYNLYITEACNNCNCLNNGSCDVVTGQESYKECEGYQDFLRTGNLKELPIDEDKLLFQYEKNNEYR